MKGKKYLAFDFGAESGRAILGAFDDKKVKIQELHRFPNPQIRLLDHVYWDVLSLFQELKNALSITVKKGHRLLQGIGVDTWGVEFGIIAEDGHLLSNPVVYRDQRTEGMMERVFRTISKKEIYQLTGIQFLQLNTLYQLASLVKDDSPLLSMGRHLLFMPDLFNYFMTGEICSEYTIASTSQLLNAKTKEWEERLFSAMRIPSAIMSSIIPPCTVLGSLRPELLEETGLKSGEVIAPAGHDTACAVAAVPVQNDHWAYISSGTWSLLGIETDHPIISEASLQNNFTNEGGVNNKIRFLKNTMGMWLLEGCRRAWSKNEASVDYDLLMNMAGEAKPFQCIIDPDNGLFMNPQDMPGAIIEYSQMTGQVVPQDRGEFVRCILESLALKYRYLIDKINHMGTRKIEVLHIVGGGSRNQMLNQFAANATGLPVITGPAEATAIGNIILQLLANKELYSLKEARDLVARSFPGETYEPRDQEQWNEIYHQKKNLFS